MQTSMNSVDGSLRLISPASEARTFEHDNLGQREFGVRQARFELSNRRDREKTFPNEFFGEAAWTMMLELYVSGHHGRPLLVTSLCASSGEPQTTALRWIAILESKGIIRKTPSATDKRARMISLTDQAMQDIDRYFANRKHRLV